MSALIVILIPAAISAYTLLVAWSLVGANIAAASIILCLTGALRRRYGLIVGGAFVALLNYASMVTQSGDLRLWPSLAVGLGLFLLLEVAYDVTVAVRVSVSWKTYRPRVRSMIRTVVLASIGFFLFATLGFNAATYVSSQPTLSLGLLAGVIAVAAVASLILFRAKRDLPRPTQEKSEKRE